MFVGAGVGGGCRGCRKCCGGGSSGGRGTVLPVSGVGAGVGAVFFFGAGGGPFGFGGCRTVLRRLFAGAGVGAGVGAWDASNIAVGAGVGALDMGSMISSSG